MLKEKYRQSISLILLWGIMLAPLPLFVFKLFLGDLSENFWLFFVFIEAIMFCVLAVVWLRSRFIAWFAIPSLILMSVIVIPQITSDYFDIHQDVIGFLVLFVYGLFWLAALGIIFAGIKSIVEKTSIYYSGLHQLSEAHGAEAIMWGTIYLIIGLMFSVMLLSLTHASVCENNTGLCFYLELADELFSGIDKLPTLLRENPFILLLAIGSLAAGFYTFLQKRK